MKIISSLKRTSLLLAATLFLTILSVSCNRDDGNSTNANYKTYTLSGTASGAQVFPSVVTNAAATLTGTYNAGSNKFSYTISWTGLASAATAVQLLGPANPGQNGFLLFTLPITSSGTTGTATGSVIIPQQELDLFNGRIYYTISNATYTAGEIRAQVTATAQ